jgi:hypothetical protein
MLGILELEANGCERGPFLRENFFIEPVLTRGVRWGEYAVVYFVCVGSKISGLDSNCCVPSAKVPHQNFSTTKFAKHMKLEKKLRTRQKAKSILKWTNDFDS